MISGHVNNECDSSFGLVMLKRLFCRRDVLHPPNMIEVINYSSWSTTCISSSEVTWLKRKKLLASHSKVPSSFKIALYNYFTVRKDVPDVFLLSDCMIPLNFCLTSWILPMFIHRNMKEEDYSSLLKLWLYILRHTLQSVTPYSPYFRATTAKYIGLSVKLIRE